MKRTFTVKVAVNGFVVVDVEASNGEAAIVRAVEEVERRMPTIPTDDIKVLPWATEVESVE